MAKYTIELRTLIENKVPIFDDSYSIFDEAYRSTLEKNIIDYFYFREIGFETVGQFLFRLRAKLRLIMPYYNKMYESTLLKFDPLLNYEVREVYKRKVANNNARLYSDTPQGRITLEGAEHLTDITEDKAQNDEDFERTMSGNIGVMNYSTLLSDFRNSFIRVDEMVIKELENLFMQVY